MKGKFKAFFVALALCLINRVWGFSGERTVLMEFKHAPFPLKQSSASSSFYDVNDNGRRGHTALGGTVYWEDTNYNDNRVLLSIAPQFSVTKDPLIIVYLHGNLATLERDVRGRQQVPAQLAASGINALLVAPQFAVDAADSSVGHFAEKGYFIDFLDEVAMRVGDWQANPKYNAKLQNAPVILVAYSGGYRAAAKILEHSENIERVRGVILLDGLYAFENSFADWIEDNHRHIFFFSSYTEGAGTNNLHLQDMLRTRGIHFETVLPPNLAPGSISFLNLENEADHFNFVNNAWTEHPLSDLLKRIQYEQ